MPDAATPNKVLQTNKAKLSCLLHAQKHARSPLPLIFVVRPRPTHCGKSN
jgi:hypothetical protein